MEYLGFKSKSGCLSALTLLFSSAVAIFCTPFNAGAQESQGLLVPETVFLKAHLFKYGSEDGDADEAPMVNVEMDDFSISRYEITFAQYDQFAQETGRALPDDEGVGRGSFPVFNVTFEDAKNYARWLSRKTGKKWRLPTEYEWEYAAGLGVNHVYTNGVADSELCRFANIADSSARETQNSPNITECDDGAAGVAEVGQYAPNNASIYDIHGNVWEWTDNCYREVNGTYNPFSCDTYTIRGGSFLTPATSTRVTNREKLDEDERLNQVGFRLVKER